MPSIYKKHDVYLYTPEWPEPFPTAPLEAMACGIPVIGTSIGGASEIFRHGENALTFTPGDVDQLAGCMLRTKQLEQNILISIDNAIKSANTYYETIQSTRAAREYAEEALKAEQKKLEVGQSTSFQVLQLQKDLTAARLNEIRALANYNEALATVASNEGTTLEKYKLTVKVN